MQNTDTNILQLIERLKVLGIIRFNKEFCDAIDLQKQNLISIQNGTAHFTVKHIDLICKRYNVNVSWIFGTDPQMFSKKKGEQKSVQMVQGILF